MLLPTTLLLDDDDDEVPETDEAVDDVEGVEDEDAVTKMPIRAADERCAAAII